MERFDRVMDRMIYMYHLHKNLYMYPIIETADEWRALGHPSVGPGMFQLMHESKERIRDAIECLETMRIGLMRRHAVTFNSIEHTFPINRYFTKLDYATPAVR